MGSFCSLVRSQIAFAEREGSDERFASVCGALKCYGCQRSESSIGHDDCLNLPTSQLPLVHILDHRSELLDGILALFRRGKSLCLGELDAICLFQPCEERVPMLVLPPHQSRGIFFRETGRSARTCRSQLESPYHIVSVYK
jgi:hypothetical protein